ncbi:MFS transporter, partial [Sulfolobus sp. C3]
MLNKLIPYWVLVFSIGFGWFILSPIIPVLSNLFKVSISSILLIISSYGYSMAILGILAGYLSARFTVKTSLILS